MRKRPGQGEKRAGRQGGILFLKKTGLSRSSDFTAIRKQRGKKRQTLPLGDFNCFKAIASKINEYCFEICLKKAVAKNL